MLPHRTGWSKGREGPTEGATYSARGVARLVGKGLGLAPAKRVLQTFVHVPWSEKPVFWSTSQSPMPQRRSGDQACEAIPKRLGLDRQIHIDLNVKREQVVGTFTSRHKKSPFNLAFSFSLQMSHGHPTVH